MDTDRTEQGNSLTANEYVALLRARRDETWNGLGLPPLLEWFIRPGDDALHTPSPEVRQYLAAPKPARPRKSVEEFTAERDRAVIERDSYVGEVAPDRAAVAGVAMGVRRTRRAAMTMDSRLQKWAEASRRVEKLEERIRRAQSVQGRNGERVDAGR